jgi:hypothetical protein
MGYFAACPIAQPCQHRKHGLIALSIMGFRLAAQPVKGHILFNPN